MHAISIHCNYKQRYMTKCENGKKIYKKSFVSMFANFVIVSVIVAAGISIAVSVKGNGISLNYYN